MILRILGDSHRNFDGKLEAQFIDLNNESKNLYFDVNDWKDIPSNGIINGEEIKLFNPTPLSIDFDREYRISDEEFELIFEILKLNGWTEKRHLL